MEQENIVKSKKRPLGLKNNKDKSKDKASNQSRKRLSQLIKIILNEDI